MTSSLSDDRHRTLIPTLESFRPNGVFRDVMPLLADRDALRYTYEQLRDFVAPLKPDYIAGVDASGFILGGALAVELGCGFIAIRKAGKLPGSTIGAQTTGEYSTDRLEIRTDILRPGDRVVIHDDVVATGDCTRTAVTMLRELGAEVVGVCSILDKAFIRRPDELDYVTFKAAFRVDE